MLLAGTAIGTYLERTRSEEENQTRYFDFRTQENPGVLSRPSIPGRELSVLLDNEPIENISTVSLRLFNHSDRDYENVPVRLTIRAGKEGEKLEVLHARLLGPGGVEIAPPAAPLAQTQGPEQTIALTLGTANRSESFDDAILDAYFIVKGPQAPTVEFYVDKKGVRARAYTYSGYDLSFVDFLGILASRDNLLLLAAFLALLLFNFRISRIFDARRQAWLRDALVQDLVQQERRSELRVADADGNSLADYFLNYQIEFQRQHPGSLKDFLRAWRERSK